MRTASTIDTDLDPLDYPWMAHPTSYLLNPDGSTVPAWMSPSGQLVVQTTGCDGDLVDVALQDVGAAPMADRVAVLGIGSNSAPQVMHAKLADRCPDGVGHVVVQACTVQSMALGFAPSWAHRGYLGWTPYHDPFSSVRCSIAWVTPDQARAIDSTEPSYDRVVLDSRFTVIGVDTEVSCYAADALLAIRGVPIMACGQAALHQLLAPLVPEVFDADPRQVVRALVRLHHDRPGYQQRKDYFEERGLVVASGMKVS